MKTKELIVKDYQTKADIKYSDFEQLTKSLEGQNLEDIDPNFLTMRILKIFYNISPTEARKLKQEQVDLLVGKIGLILNQPKSELKTIIEMNGKQYGLIPKFVDITAGELIDLDELYREKNFIGLTSILYRPIIGNINKIGEYQIEEYTGYNDKFKNISLDIVEGYMSFFTKSYQILNQATQPVIQ